MVIYWDHGIDITMVYIFTIDVPLIYHDLPELEGPRSQFRYFSTNGTWWDSGTPGSIHIKAQVHVASSFQVGQNTVKESMFFQRAWNDIMGKKKWKVDFTCGMTFYPILPLDSGNSEALKAQVLSTDRAGPWSEDSWKDSGRTLRLNMKFWESPMVAGFPYIDKPPILAASLFTSKVS